MYSPNESPQKAKDLFLEDKKLEDRLKLLAGSDIVEEGSTVSHYKGISDDFFNQVVQKLYTYEQFAYERNEKKYRFQPL